MASRWPLLSIALSVACSSASGGSGTTGTGGAAGGSSSSNGASSSSGGSSSSGSSSNGSTSSSGASSSSGGGAGSACSHGLPEYTADDGSVTFYTFAMGSTGVNCGFDILGQNPDAVAHAATGNGQFFGAMNTADYDTAATCGACVEVTRDGTKKVTVTIVDQCPSAGNPPCKSGHIDLSKEAFLQIGMASEGYLGTGNGGAVGKISWRYVACPVTEKVSFRLKEPTNMYWNQILVEGHRFAISKLEVLVNGQWVSAVRQSYNYWQAGSGDMGPAPYQVRVTDVNGDTIEASLDLAAGDQVSSAQFPLCQ